MSSSSTSVPSPSSASSSSSNGRSENIDWIFISALLRRCLIPLITSFFFYYFLLFIISPSQPFLSFFLMKFLVFILILWVNLLHFAYLHSYLPLNYQTYSSKLICSLLTIVLGWNIGGLLHEILSDHNPSENYFLYLTSSLVSIFTLFNCTYFSCSLVSKSIVPPTLSLVFRHSILSSSKQILLQLLVFLGIFSMISIILVLSLKFPLILALKMLSRGFVCTLILRALYSFISSAFSVMITYPMNFSKLSPSTSLKSLLLTITGSPPTIERTKKLSSDSYFPFQIQFQPSQSPSLPFTSLTPSPSLSLHPKASSSFSSSFSNNDFHVKWKNIFALQDQLNTALFKYLEQNYNNPTKGLFSIHWMPSYEPFLVPTLYEMYQLDERNFNSHENAKPWNVALSFLPSILGSLFILPIRRMYFALRQSLALHDINRIARSPHSTIRKHQLFQSSETISTLTHALLTLVNSATLQLNILASHGQIEFMDTVGHKSNLLATFYSHLLDPNPVKLPPPKHWFFAILLRVMKWFNSVFKFSKYIHPSRLQEAVSYEISSNPNVDLGSTKKTSEIKSSTLTIFHKRRQDRENTVIGAIFNALISLFPSITQQLIHAVPFSCPLSLSFTEDTISAIESLTFLLIPESRRDVYQIPSSSQSPHYPLDSHPYSSSSRQCISLFSYCHHYLPIILTTLISLHLQLKEYISYRILYFYSKNCSSFSQYLDYKLSPGVYYNIHQFNMKSSGLSPRIISENLMHIEHVLDCSINQIICYYHDIVLTTYSYPPEITQRITELLKKRGGVSS